MTLHFFRISVVAALFWTLFPSASAAALYSASSEASLEVVDVTNLTTPGSLVGLELIGDAFVTTNFSRSSGVASASTGNVTVAPAILDVGDSIELLAEVGGEATLGESQADVLTDGELQLTNTSATDEFWVDLQLSYALAAAIDVPSGALGEASAAAFVFAFRPEGVVAIENVVIDRSSLAMDQSASDVVDFRILLGPGESDLVRVFADAAGDAVGVPEPATLLPLSLGLLAMARWRRTRRRPTVRSY